MKIESFQGTVSSNIKGIICSYQFKLFQLTTFQRFEYLKSLIEVTRS